MGRPDGQRPVVLVTGATSGHGRAVALELARRGWTVLGHGRDEARLAELRRALAGPRGDEAPHAYAADLASIDAVHRLADAVLARHERLDALVNNAGIYAAQRRRPRSADGHELTLAVNHLAHFALTMRLLELPRSSAPARIVNVSSIGQAPLDFGDLMLERAWDPWQAYARSKLAQVMFTISLAERLGAGADAGAVTVNALHPATLMDTAMARAIARPRSTVAEGAAATVRLVADPALRGVTGRFFDGVRESAPHPQAGDREARERLWTASERLTGTAFDAR